MLTNIYRLTGLHQMSWFQLLPDLEQLSPNKNRKERSPKEMAATCIMVAHLRLQDGGYFSAWTVSQAKEASSRPALGDAVKLWIFTPGRQESISPALHPVIMGLKVVGAGLWCAPGDNDEVGSALCDALRNRVERSLRVLSYVRYGDVFVKCRRHAANETRKLPTCELMFMASEEAIFVHAVVRRKRVRLLLAEDLQAVLAHHNSNGIPAENSVSVIVSPHGLVGRLTGCCPGDLVSQLYRSKLQAFAASSLPFRVVSSSSISTGSVHTLYSEVWLGNTSSGMEISTRTSGNAGTFYGNGDPSLDRTNEGEHDPKVKSSEDWKADGKVLIYPMDAVLVPLLPSIPSRTYLRRCWLQEWSGTHWLEDISMPGLTWCRAHNASGKEKSTNLRVWANSSHVQYSNSNSSSSGGTGGSSIKSSSSHSGSSSTSGSNSSSDSESAIGGGEIEADADSVASKAALAVNRTSVTNSRTLGQAVDSVGTKRGRPNHKATGEPQSKVAKRTNSSGEDMPVVLDVGIHSKGNVGELSIQGSLSIGAGTPRGVGSQVGTPLYWTDEGMGMGMGMDMQTDADILAEFGDFGDFFEDDGLGFGEPPGTAESQSLMFSLDCGDVDNTSGTMYMDASDPMLLPILDFPTLEGFGQQSVSVVKEQSVRGTKGVAKEILQQQSEKIFSPPLPPVVSSADSLPKAEAMMIFAPGFAPVDLPRPKDEIAFSTNMYLPDARKASAETVVRNASYIYGPTPPIINLKEGSDKSVQVMNPSVEECGESKKASKLVAYTLVTGASGSYAKNTKPLAGGGDNSSRSTVILNKKANESGLGSNGSRFAENPTSRNQPTKNRSAGGRSTRSTRPNAMLASELECSLLQASFLFTREEFSPCNGASRQIASALATPQKSPAGPLKENTQNTPTQGDQLGRGSLIPTQSLEKKKQERIPSRIAGDADEDLQDGPRAAQVGVWRPVQAPKPQKAGSTDTRLASSIASPDAGSHDGVVPTGVPKPVQGQWSVDAIPLLAQQAAVAYDVALDGECGDGSLGWLIFQELQKHRGICGPGTTHSGCGGFLSSRHYHDNAGVEFMDPMATEVTPATVASLLQSDMRVAMIASFGESNMEGPLTLLDWCRGKIPSGEASNYGGILNADSKEVSSTITMAGTEPVTPLQGNAGSGSGLKTTVVQDVDQEFCRGNSRIMDTSTLSDQNRGDDQRRPGEEAGIVDLDMQGISGIYGATIFPLPVPALLVGYQDDWLKTSPNVLRLWEKAPLEPYASPKEVSYFVVCLGLDSLVSAASDFLHQLTAVYEACRLGSHMPAVASSSLTGLVAGSGKYVAPGFLIIDSPASSVQLGSAVGQVGDFMANMLSSWSFNDFRKGLLKLCKAIPASVNPTVTLRDPDQSNCTVVYIISPSSEPAEVLQVILDASQSLGSAVAEKERRAVGYNSAVVHAEDVSLPIVGFSTPRLVFQVLTAETVLKANTSIASELDLLKEVAFGVYNKARRIQRKSVVSESVQPTHVSTRSRPGVLQGGGAMQGMWKDCNTSRSSGGNTLLESGSIRNWDGTWQPSSASRFGDSPAVDGGGFGSDGQNLQEASRFLYEPLFILAESGSTDYGASYTSSLQAGKEGLRTSADETPGSTSGGTLGASDSGSNILAENSDAENHGSGSKQVADLHCCYAWTEDWKWMVSVWTDARGELLDIHVLPLVNNQKESGFLNVFIQILQQGLQLLLLAVEAGSPRSRSLVISRLGGFSERECHEWYRSVILVGGDDARKWPVQLWPAVFNGNSPAQSQDLALLSDRTLGLASSSSRPPSPSPSSFSSRPKPIGVGASLARRQGQSLSASQPAMDVKGPFQWVHSISLVSVRVEHGLQTLWVSDSAISAGVQGGTAASAWTTGSVGNSNTTAVGTSVGLGAVRTLASVGASYMLVPTRPLRLLSPQVPQLPATLSRNMPTLGQLLHGSVMASPIASAFIISPPTPNPRTEFFQQAMKEDWPSTLSVQVVAHSGNFLSAVDLPLRTDSISMITKSPKETNKELLIEGHRVAQVVAAQLHALSWLSVSPTILQRWSPLPFHCNVAQRLRRLLSHMDTEHGDIQTPSFSTVRFV